jgi:hypothetical protein
MSDDANAAEPPNLVLEVGVWASDEHHVLPRSMGSGFVSKITTISTQIEV